MAFASSNLTLLSLGGFFHQVYVYKTTADTLKTIASATAATYFAYPNASTGNLDPMVAGDVLYIVGSDGQGTFRVGSVSAGSTAVVLAPVGPVYAAPAGTTSANVVPYGLFLSTIGSSSTTTFTLDAPWGAGHTMYVSHVGSATAITLAGASTVAGFFNSTGVQLLFNAPNQGVTLVATSTASWQVVSRAQPGTAIIGPLES